MPEQLTEGAPAPGTTQPSAQVPATQPQPTAQQAVRSVDGDDQVVLQDIGYLQNLFQGSISSRRVKLTLYVTHLKFEDAGTGELLEDVPIGHIGKTSKLIPNSYYGDVYLFLFATPLMIETPTKKYKISWSDADASSVWGAGWRPASVARDQPRNMEWVKAIASLKRGQLPDMSGYVAHAPQTLPNATAGDSDYIAPNKVFGYVVLSIPVLFVIACGAVYVYSQATNSHTGWGLLGLVIGAVIGLPGLALGLLFGLRNIRG